MVNDFLVAIAGSALAGAALTWLLRRPKTQEVQEVGQHIIDVAEQVLPVLDAVLRFYPGLGVGQYRALIQAILKTLGMGFRIKTQDDLVALIEYLNKVFSPEISQNRTDFPSDILSAAEMVAGLIRNGKKQPE